MVETARFPYYPVGGSRVMSGGRNAASGISSYFTRSAAMIGEYFEAKPKSFFRNSSLFTPHSSLDQACFAAFLFCLRGLVAARRMTMNAMPRKTALIGEVRKGTKLPLVFIMPLR